MQLSGQITAVSGACPAVTFVLDRQTVYTTGATKFSKGPCKDLKAGKKVDVEGWFMSDQRVRADEVKSNK